MVKSTEDPIVIKLKDEQWLKTEFELERLESYQDVYYGPDVPRTADLVGIDRNKKVYAFEVKREGRGIGAAFDQASDYSQGANFVYCVLEAKSAGEASKKMLEKTGIGLILYRLEKGSLTGIETKKESDDHKGPFVERTRDSMTEKVDTPDCYVFPCAPRKWFEELWRDSARHSEEKLSYWGYGANVRPPRGSIIIFSSKGFFIGQGIVVDSRSTTEDDRKKGFKSKSLLVLWRKSILKYPRDVPISDVQGSINLIRTHSLKDANFVLRRYPKISSPAGLKVVSKALDVFSSNKRPPNSG